MIIEDASFVYQLFFFTFLIDKVNVLLIVVYFLVFDFLILSIVTDLNEYIMYFRFLNISLTNKYKVNFILQSLTCVSGWAEWFVSNIAKEK